MMGLHKFFERALIARVADSDKQLNFFLSAGHENLPFNAGADS